ncbi:hypothetical protein H0E87_005686, partial [Populus deltoides]
KEYGFSSGCLTKRSFRGLGRKRVRLPLVDRGEKQFDVAVRLTGLWRGRRRNTIVGLPVVARPCMAGASDGHGEGLEVKVTIFTGRMRRSWVDAGV